MKKLILLLALAAIAQTRSHYTILNWSPTEDPGATYNVYRASGICTPGQTFTKLTSGLTLATYQDNAVVVGSYCYQITATVAGAESVPSSQMSATVVPFSPLNLQTASQ